MTEQEKAELRAILEALRDQIRNPAFTYGAGASPSQMQRLNDLKATIASAFNGAV